MRPLVLVQTARAGIKAAIGALEDASQQHDVIMHRTLNEQRPWPKLTGAAP